MPKRRTDSRVVVIGAGPVGLWTAIQLKKRRPASRIVIYEKYLSYRRSHVLRIDMSSLSRLAFEDGTPRELEFLQAVSGEMRDERRTRRTLLRTQELEAILKKYAQDLGISIQYAEVESAQALRDQHPECEVFIGADGAHSVVRQQIFGDEYRYRKDLHHVIELKYEVAGSTRPLDILTEHYRSIKLMPTSVFEHVGRERDTLTPITLRFFVAKNVYDRIGEASFKHPVTIENYQQRLPATLSDSINLYLTIRKELLGDDPMFSTMKLGKLTLAVYGSASFSKYSNHANWYLVGDAAMGVPFFRSLNAGLLCGSKLAQLLSHSSEVSRDYSSYASRRFAIELARARAKSAGIHLHAAFVRASSVVPWQVNKWRRQEIEHYMQQLYEDEASAEFDSPRGSALPIGSARLDK